jgi:hypothetical protein
MSMDLEVLQCGKCEELKLGIHATALGLVALMGLYNAAAWLSRRQGHLAFNAVMYAALTVWEQQHVVHHIAEIRNKNLVGVAPSAPEKPMPEVVAALPAVIAA